MSNYFSHDYGARNDPKLVRLQMEMGHDGKGIFWDLIELLYEQEGYILVSELKSISFALHTQYERITDVLNNYDLFKNDGNAYWSESVLKRLEKRCEKSVKARQSVLKRWDDYRKNTNVLRTNNEGNTIKESKVKERKEKKENKNDIVFPFTSTEFLETWSVLIKQPKWKGKSKDALIASANILETYTEDIAIGMMKKAIASNWQGLFPLNEKESAEIIQNAIKLKASKREVKW